MENRKGSAVPVRDQGPVQARGRDFEPVVTPPPQIDDQAKPPSSYDCTEALPECPEEAEG
jgi:hypothetical protein